MREESSSCSNLRTVLYLFHIVYTRYSQPLQEPHKIDWIDLE
jgi:hypothetical protein